MGTGHRTQEHDTAHAVTGQVRRGTEEETPWPPPAQIKSNTNVLYTII